MVNNKTFFKDLDEVEKSMFNFLKLYKQNDSQIQHTYLRDVKLENHNIKFDDIDYYYSNVIARASKTMSECRNIKIESKKTGTES